MFLVVEFTESFQRFHQKLSGFIWRAERGEALRKFMKSLKVWSLRNLYCLQYKIFLDFLKNLLNKNNYFQNWIMCWKLNKNLPNNRKLE